jgi:hypothetical protein
VLVREVDVWQSGGEEAIEHLQRRETRPQHTKRLPARKSIRRSANSRK